MGQMINGVWEPVNQSIIAAYGKGLIRCDGSYVTRVKCNFRRIAECPALRAHTQRLYRMLCFVHSCDFGYISQHYYQRR
jgi:glutathionyl-hydroquinone reductase